MCACVCPPLQELLAGSVCRSVQEVFAGTACRKCLSCVLQHSRWKMEGLDCVCLVFSCAALVGMCGGTYTCSLSRCMVHACICTAWLMQSGMWPATGHVLPDVRGPHDWLCMKMRYYSVAQHIIFTKFVTLYHAYNLLTTDVYNMLTSPT